MSAGMDHAFDVAVVGSGPGGYRAAVLAALRGLRVAIVEKAEWGGCCLNRGCVPKKDWYSTARLIAAQRHFTARGIQGALHADLNRAWDHQKQVAATVRASYLDFMKRLGINTYVGCAALQDGHTLHIALANGGSRRITARNVVLATGGRPFIPPELEPVPGRILTTDMLFDARPPAGQRVALIGSGIVATEFAFILAMLGKEVVWLTRSPPLHRTRFSTPARTVLMEALRRHGIEPRQPAHIASATVRQDGVTVTLHDGSTLEVDWVCLGTGRVPNTTKLGLENAGVLTDERGFIGRNVYLQTSVPHIYAIGDCAAPVMTANQALADATVAVQNIVQPGSMQQDDRRVPLVVYSAVELARVGLNEDQAEDEGREPAVGFAAFETSPCALGQADTDGFVRLIGDMDDGTLLGGEIVGAEAGELIHLLALAPDPESALAQLAAGRYNHPARAEELLNAAETMASKWGMADRIFVA